MKETIKFVIFATQRTGSMLLLDLLNSHPKIAALGELFQNKNENVQHDVPRYKQFKNGKKLDSLRFRLKGKGILNNLSILTERYMLRKYLNIVFFHQGHVFDAVGFKLMVNQVQSYPMILNYIQTYKFKIILLERRNILKTYLSRLRVEQTGVTTSKKRSSKFKIMVPVDSLIENLNKIHDEKINLIKFVKRSGLDYHKLEYEQYTKDLEHAEKEVLDFLDIKIVQDLQSSLMKLTPDSLADAVDNYHGVVRKLRYTKYERYLK